MSSWRDVAAAALAQKPNVAPVAERGQFGLPSDLTAALRTLQTLPPPKRIERPENWRGVVEDALRIAREGWAAKALAFGWSAYDLFGVGPVDDWEFSGLAVWLVGRPIVNLNPDRAMAAGPETFGSVFIRGGMGHGTHPTIEPVLLWEFGR